MHVKNIIYEDFIQYKKPSMFIGSCICDFKCDKLNGKQICQNSSLALSPTYDIDDNKIITSYLSNPITSAIVFGGLEIMDQFEELVEFLIKLRRHTNDDVVIYTGYNKDELIDKIVQLKNFSNIIIKYGRYKIGENAHFDSILGVNLASSNQYAEKIS